ncbi:uncharacterized protein LOC129001121 isoform X2 [Macrosteles quadrilineatus]|uniref:uncharacterized protein LOC129001121 isoform X2 n=1 Tax=Macrosteles quadrilineatus TaxID=74068 RepID=UPI0023E1B91F|nr:uncharacterized protein LOC129001121 isoform X2 [Macrosteles quadrilineatus]
MNQIIKSVFFNRFNVYSPSRNLFLSSVEVKARCYCDQKEDKNNFNDSLNKSDRPINKSDTDELVQPGLESRYKVFHDEDAPILLDVYAEKMLEETDVPETVEEFHGLSLEPRSRRHMTAIAQIVRRMFKKKRNESDIIPRIEGEGSSTWIALDLGNIALHIFSPDARTFYDLETLWSVGTEYDSLSNTADDPLVALLKKHSITLHEVSSKGQLL